VSVLHRWFCGTRSINGVVGRSYDFQVTAVAVPFPQFSVGDGALPPGLNLDSASVVIGGTPITTGTFNFSITVSNGIGSPAVAPHVISVYQPSDHVRRSSFQDQ
jgi:hypothetical protein